jgi:hypothetical protein
MKRAFVSYSIEDRNLFMITLLLEYLRNNNYVISVSNNDFTNCIINADIFIGIITKNSSNNKHVVSECQIARKNNIPFVLVVENGVKMPSEAQGMFIRFDRSNPQEAIDKLFKIKKPVPTVPKKKNDDDMVRDVLIGAVVIIGLAALIRLLSQNE